MQSLKKPIIFFPLLIGIGLWGILVYSNTFKVPFQFDDEKFILRNPAIRSLDAGNLWHDLAYRKRFVSFYSFALNYHLHGPDVTGYHIVNLAIHILAAFFVFWLVLLLFNTPRIKKDKISENKHTIALLCGWLFVSHPLQTEAVTYISQRTESLASLFYLISVCLYIRGRTISGKLLKSSGCFFLSVISAVLGMLTKEIVFTLPLALILIEWLFFQSKADGQPAERSPKVKKGFWVYLGVIFTLTVSMVFVLSLNLPRIFAEHAQIGITSGRYFFTQFPVIMKYVRLLFLPFGQNLDYDIPLSSSLFEGYTFLCALCIAVLFFEGIKLTSRYPLLGFGILWFFLTLSVTSSIVPLRDWIFEHRLYLPMVGFAVVLCAGLFYLTKSPRIPVLCLSGFILMLSFLTYQRNVVWTDSVKLWEDTVRKSPHKARPYINLGKAYRWRMEYGKAEKYYLRALEFPSNNPRTVAQVYINLSAVYGELKKYQKGIACCLKAIELDPQNPQAYSNVGYSYTLIRNNEKALEYGKKAVELAPQFDEGLNNLGVIYVNMGQLEKAAELFERTLEINPYYEKALLNLNMARSLIQQGYSAR